MPEIVQIGLIGCGGMMGAHVHGLQLLWEAGYRGFLVPAVCDCEEDRAIDMAHRIEQFQEQHPRVYTDYMEMLEKEPDLDAVDLSLVHRIHHSVAIPCLCAGKHVTTEKPLGFTIRACHEIINTAKQHNRILQVAENYRRAPAERAINWAIRQGMIGELRMIYWIDVGERLFYWGWRDEVDEAGGGWSMDGGVHFADLFRYHVGEIESLYAISRAYSPVRYGKPETMEDPIGATVEDTTMAVLQFENGATGQWTSTLAAPGKGFSDRVLYGSKGCISWDDGVHTRTESLTIDELTQRFMDSISQAEKDRWFPLGVTDTVATEQHEFFEAIRTGSPIEIDGVEGMKDEAISLALYESSELNAPVELASVENCEVEAYQQRFNKMVGL